MNSAKHALKENNGVVNFGITNAGPTPMPEYFRVAMLILEECKKESKRKNYDRLKKQAASVHLDKVATGVIGTDCSGTMFSPKRKGGEHFLLSPSTSTTPSKKIKVVVRWIIT